MPLKIGVITFHYAVNYGALMQAYGLTQRLARAGHEVEIIDFRSPVGRRYVLRAIAGRRWNLPAMTVDYRKYRRFMRFLKQRFRRSPDLYRDGAMMHELHDRYDLVVSGSDQVWNTHTFGYEPAYFLHFADPERSHLASYAPSAGMTTDWGDNREEIAELLMRFDSLSARDASTEQMVEQAIGVRPTRVLDPTFLHDFADIAEDRRATDDPYILVYHVQRSELVDRWVDLIKQKLGMKAIVVGAPTTAADRTDIVVSPERWLGYVKHAAMVVTNSFHGTIFSLKQRTPFVIVPHPTGTMRLADLMQTVGATQRLLPDEASEAALPADFTTPDFDAMHARLAKPIADSHAFVDRAIAAAEQKAAAATAS